MHWALRQRQHWLRAVGCGQPYISYNTAHATTGTRHYNFAPRYAQSSGVGTISPRGTGGKKTPSGRPTEVGGWVLFLGISGPEKHLFVFRFSQDTPPQMTQRTSLLCLCVGGQETPEVPYPTDLSSGYKTGPEYRKTAGVHVCGIGSKWPSMGLQHATYAWEVC
jgi:hypothetical protein